MRRHLHRSQLIDAVFGIIGLVGAERDHLRPIGARLDHVQRGDALSMAVRRRQAGVDEERMTVFHQSMADEAELGFLAGPFAIEPRLGVGRRRVRFVRTLLAVEVRFLVAPAAVRRRFVHPSLGRKLFIEAQAWMSVPSTEK